MGSLSSITAKSVAVGVGLLAATTMSIGTAGAAPQETRQAATATNASSTVPVTAEAKAAGKAKFGAKATDSQSLQAYWTPERMRSAIPADSTQDFAA